MLRFLNVVTGESSNGIPMRHGVLSSALSMASWPEVVVEPDRDEQHIYNLGEKLLQRLGTPDVVF